MEIVISQLQQALQQTKTVPFSTERNAFDAHALSPFLKEQKSLLIERATEYFAQNIPNVTFTQFAQYEQTGDRQAYQIPYFQRRERLLTFALLVFLEPENEQYKTELCEIIWAICSEPFWTLPAHFSAATGEPLPFAQYETMLDLFSCETAAALCETLALTRDYLPELLVTTVETQVWRRCLTPFANEAQPYRFEVMHNNWNAVCGSALGIAAIYLVKDEALLAKLLARAVASNEVYLASFGADGICTEGVDYWTYGFGFFACFAALLAERTGNIYDYFAQENVQTIARTGSVFYLSEKASIAFADGYENSQYRMGLACFLAERTGSSLPPSHLAAPTLSDPCGRFCLGIRDFFWSCEAATRNATPNGATWYPDAQWFLAKLPTLSLAAKAGHNGESHNHNDCGSFSLFCEGKQVICDLGAGLYDKAYFSDTRYDIFVNRSASHNIPLFAGAEQQAGTEYRPSNIATTIGETSAHFCMELQDCYPSGCVARCQRQYNVVYAQDQVVLTDEITLQEGSFTEVFCAREPITIKNDTVRFTRDNTEVKMVFDAQQFTATYKEETYQDHEDVTQTAYLLHLTSKPLHGNTITTKFTFHR